eukprot:scaffold3347_cov382-Prasinococcus_capsulatus_cf.AAC.7
MSECASPVASEGSWPLEQGGREGRSIITSPAQLEEDDGTANWPDLNEPEDEDEVRKSGGTTSGGPGSATATSQFRPSVRRPRWEGSGQEPPDEALLFAPEYGLGKPDAVGLAIDLTERCLRSSCCQRRGSRESYFWNRTGDVSVSRTLASKYMEHAAHHSDNHISHSQPRRAHFPAPQHRRRQPQTFPCHNQASHNSCRGAPERGLDAERHLFAAGQERGPHNQRHLDLVRVDLESGKEGYFSREYFRRAQHTLVRHIHSLQDERAKVNGGHCGKARWCRLQGRTGLTLSIARHWHVRVPSLLRPRQRRS